VKAIRAPAMWTILGRRTSSNVMLPLWVADELGIPFEQVDLGGEFGGLDRPGYLAKNPNGLVPTIDDDGFVLWESNAIVRYLANKHGKGTMAPSDPKEYADADRWMDWQQTTVLPVMTVTSFGQGEPDTILSGVKLLIEAGMWPVALLVFFASITVPVVKIVVMIFLLVSVQMRSRWRPRPGCGCSISSINSRTRCGTAKASGACTRPHCMAVRIMTCRESCAGSPPISACIMCTICAAGFPITGCPKCCASIRRRCGFRTCGARAPTIGAGCRSSNVGGGSRPGMAKRRVSGSICRR